MRSKVIGKLVRGFGILGFWSLFFRYFRCNGSAFSSNTLLLSILVNYE